MQEEITYLYFIYNNLEPNHIYIGITYDLARRKKDHLEDSLNLQDSTYIHAAIHKYGRDNFTFQHFETFSSRDEANKAERFYIKYFREQPNYTVYNIHDGGEGCPGEIMRNHLSKMWRGEKGPLAKLTQERVDLIREIYKLKKYPHSFLATEFKVSKSTITGIISGRYWRDDLGSNFQRITPTPQQIEARNDMMVKEYAIHQSLDQLHEKYKLTKKTIRKILVSLNAEVRDLAKEKTITESQVMDIFYMLKNSSDEEIHKKTFVSIAIIRNIRSGKCWSDITGIKRNIINITSVNKEEKSQILDLSKCGLFTFAEIGNFYHISEKTVSRIVGNEKMEKMEKMEKSTSIEGEF